MEDMADNSMNETSLSVIVIPGTSGSGESSTGQSINQDKKGYCACHNNWRTLLSIYFSEPFKWEVRTYTFNCFYIIIAALQVAKLICLSGQMISYGIDRSTFATAVHRGQLTLRHLLLENWDASWETVPYPPAHGKYAVYTIHDLENGINYAVSRYYSADNNAAAYFKRLENDKMEVIINYFYFKDGKFGKEISKSEKRFAVDHGLTNITKDNKAEYSYSIARELEFLNISEATQQMFDTTLEFTMHSVRPHYDNDEVLCLHISGKVHFNDKNYNGQIEVDLTTYTHSVPCVNMNLSVKDFELENPNKWGIAVIIFCVVSIFMSAVMLGCIISKCAEYSPSIVKICVDFIQMASDVCNIVGTSLLISQKGNELNQSSLDGNVVLLGVSCILAWLCFIRYLKINESFSLLIETLYRAKWSVIAYLICVTVLFLGFLFCGYVVLGPYHVKFQTLTAATETLFALLQGDEIYTTFAMFADDQPGNAFVQIFARFYLGCYIFLFTVVAINLLIALFNSAYETIQKQHEKGERSQVEKAFKRVYEQTDDTDFKKALQNLLGVNESLTTDDACLKKELQQVLNSDQTSQNRCCHCSCCSCLCRGEENA